MIAQDILMYEGLYKKTYFLDQIVKGLHASGVLQMIRNFPNTFMPLFVYEKVTAKDVLEAIYIDKEYECHQDVSILRGFLR